MRPALGGLTVVISVLCLTASSSAEPRSHAEALRAGDPAATAPSFLDDAGGAVYDGEPVTEAEISSQALACLAVQHGPSRCYSTARALERGERERRQAAASRKRRRPVAHASCAIYDILHIWVSADYTGSVASLADRQRWANIGKA
jgi:hypothetical protein